MKYTSSGIKAWAKEDRPRQKLMNKGNMALTDTELLAILIGSGSRKETAVSLASKILAHYNHKLNELSRASVQDLMKFKGIGEAKAITIVAAMELVKRKQISISDLTKQVVTSKDAYILCEPYFDNLMHEEFWILFLNRNNRLIQFENLSKGGVTGTIVDPRLIFKRALEHLACSIILVHNHPSGNTKPSQSDIHITKQMVHSGDMLQIKVLDHLIITSQGYYSFADEGVI